MLLGAMYGTIDSIFFYQVGKSVSSCRFWDNIASIS